MITIDLKNIQAIESAHIELPENAIIEFTGDNSNGKSIISKLIEYTTKGDIRHKDVRLSLIRDNTDNGVAIITHGKCRLGIVLYEEIKNSMIIYQSDVNDEKTMIARGLGDVEGSNALIYKFGFRTYSNGDICLQLSPTFGAVPFITTSGKTNDDIVTDITIDKIADEFLDSFKGITFPTFKAKIAKIKQELNTYQTLLDNLETYDWHAYQDIATKAQRLYSALKDYVPYDGVSDIPMPPDDIIPFEEHQIKDIPMVVFYDYGKPIADISKEFEAYMDICDGVCPTCGKRIFE